MLTRHTHLATGLVFGLALFATLAKPAAAIDGLLDPAFFVDGRHVIPASSGQVGAALYAPNGELVLAGSQGGSGFWRRLSDSVVTNCELLPPSGATSARFEDATFDPDGRLLLAGHFLYPGGARIGLARYLYPDCTLDPSFDGNGLVALDVPHETFGERADAVAVHSSGLIAVAGTVNDELSTPDSDLIVAVWTEAGALVPMFGGSGWMRLDALAVATDDTAFGVAWEGTNVVVASRVAPLLGSNHPWVLQRFELDGDADPTFGGGDGIVTTIFPFAGGDWPVGFARDGRDGGLVFAGTVDTPDGPLRNVARFLANGAPDSAFDGDGKVSIDLGGSGNDQSTSAVAVDARGRIVFGGAYQQVSASRDFLAMRLTRSGELDPTFVGDGWTTVELGLASTDGASAVAVSGRRIYLGGLSGSAWAAAALASPGLLTSGFEPGDALEWSGAVP